MKTSPIIRGTPQSRACGYFCYSPFYGGRITKLVMNQKGKLISVLKELDSETLTMAGEAFSNAILVPFPNRLYNACYSIGDRIYRLAAYSKIQPHAVHGFMYNRPAQEVIEEFRIDGSAVVMKTNYAKEVAGYPFCFEQTINYELNNTLGFTCSVSIKNNGSETLPLGIGIHPYFTCNTSIDKVCLQLPACTRIETDTDGFPTGVLSEYESFSLPAPIKETKFNDCFWAKPGLDEVEIRLTTNEVTIIYTQNYLTANYFQLYIPPDRNSIAIEPMTCAIDAFNNKRGLKNLMPGQSASCSYNIKIA